MLTAILLAIATSTSSPVVCGEIEAVCPPDFQGTTELHRNACDAFREKTRWECRANSAVKEIEAQTARANTLEARLKERPTPIAGWTTLEVFSLVASAIGGATGGAVIGYALPAETPDRGGINTAAGGAIGGLVGAGLCILLIAVSE